MSLRSFWLPRRLYEALPYLYLIGGIAALAAAFLRDDGSHGWLMMLGGASTTIGCVLWMRRRDYRDNQAEYDPRSIDD